MGLFESKLDKMTSAQLQAYAMKYGEENNMSDAAVQKMFGPKIKQKQAEETKGKNKMSKGGNATKKVPVVTIGVGMAEMKKGKKAEMAYGGMSGGKKHNYAAGGMVKDNPGLKALKAASPEAYNKITGK
jgi:hypothetical protein